MSVDKEWDRAVPDDPCHVEIRSMLLSGQAEVIGSPSGGLVVAADRSVAGVIGSPSPTLLRSGISSLAKDADLLVFATGLAVVTSVLPGAAPQRAVIHRLASPLPTAPVEDVSIGEVDDLFLASLPAELAEEVDGAVLAAVRWVDGVGVAVCGAWWPTETLWDVGVDTLPGHRRRGHARACFLELARHMGQRGLTPVWGALADNRASLRMAGSLGFVPDGELFVVELGSADPGRSAHPHDQ
ncbi:MAG TPA: GNAT family N-acetyltransferase [Acidimicrobiia bacterium]